MTPAMIQTRETRRRVLIAALMLASVAAPLPAFAAQATPTVITLGSQIEVAGAGAAADGPRVAITAGGVYQISGELADGQIEVDAPGEDVEVVLDGAAITSSDGPAILVRDAAAATLTLAPGSTNRLEDGGDTDFDAALAADVSLTIGGEGALEVIGNQNEGIASSMHLTFTGGDIHVWAVEDGINANNDDVSEIAITGGSLFVETETGDGIDSNGTITITGGTVTTVSSTDDMNGGLDADGDVTIDGGEVIATGARMSVPVAASAQHSLLLQFDQAQPAGTLVVVQDAAGETMLAFAPSNEFRQLLFSDPRIDPSETYNISMDGTPEGEAVNGRYESVSDPGEPAGTVTTASLDEGRQRRGPGGPPPDDAGQPAA